MNSKKPSFYSYGVEMNKCSGSYSNINDPYAKLCVPNVIKDANVKVFNLISRTTEQDIYNNMKLEDVNMD